MNTKVPQLIGLNTQFTAPDLDVEHSSCMWSIHSHTHSLFLFLFRVLSLSLSLSLSDSQTATVSAAILICSRRLVSMTSWTRPVCVVGQRVAKYRHPAFFCSSLIKSAPPWLTDEQLDFTATTERAYFVQIVIEQSHEAYREIYFHIFLPSETSLPPRFGFPLRKTKYQLRRQFVSISAEQRNVLTWFVLLWSTLMMSLYF